MFFSRFTHLEKRNITLYIIGIMLFKFGIESFNGTIKAYSLDRLPDSSKYEYNGYLDGFNQAAQCVGSIIIAPLIRKYNSKTVLAVSVALFAIVSSFGMIAEAATGGRLPYYNENGIIQYQYGTWNPLGIVPIFAIAGLFHGMIEILRRVIPRDIVGGNVIALKKMDSTVHIFYEIAGTLGALFSTFMSISLGKAYGAVIAPFTFIIAFFVWYAIKLEPEIDTLSVFSDDDNPIFETFKLFFVSLKEGARITCSDSRFVWLIFGYSLPLVLHRYLESGLAATYAKLVLNESAYGSIIVGGSNFGELIGAFFVFLSTNFIKTPIPWLRIDALTISFSWIFWKASPELFGTSPILTAAILAAMLVPISTGWAAGDVSLAAFIQSHISQLRHPTISPLGAVMSFLYVLYIITYAIISPVIGIYIDNLPKNSLGETIDPSPYFFYFGGIMYSLCGIVVFTATFVPKGSWHWNPEILPDHPVQRWDSRDSSYSSNSNIGVGSICGNLQRFDSRDSRVDNRNSFGLEHRLQRFGSRDSRVDSSSNLDSPAK